MTESNPRSNLVETFIDSEFWRDTVGAELYAAILDQLKLAEQVEELRRENALLKQRLCDHCMREVDDPTAAKLHVELLERRLAMAEMILRDHEHEDKRIDEYFEGQEKRT